MVGAWDAGGAVAVRRLVAWRPMMPLVAIVLTLAGGTAVAQSNDVPGLTIRVAVDDRDQRRLSKATLLVDQPGAAPVPFRDDGQVSGDVPGDRIWMVSATVARAESLTFSVLEDGVPVGRLSVALPSEGAADVATKTVVDGLVLDTRAPAMPAASGAAGQPLVVSAAPSGERVASGDGGADRITVRFSVDDQAAGRLAAGATVVVAQDGVEPAILMDDGETADDSKAGDRVYAAQLEVARAQYLGFTLMTGGDDSAPLGELSVFLPSSSEALVRLRTTESAAGLELQTEPTALGSTEAPAQSGASTAGGSGGGSDHFVHVLWVLIGLAAVGFSYVRRVVSTEWAKEVRPVVRRLDRWLRVQLDEPLDAPPAIRTSPPTEPPEPEEAP